MAGGTKYTIDVQTRGAKQSEKQIKGVNASLGNLAKKAATAAGAYFGARMLLDGIKQSILAFGQQEEAEKKLRFAAGDMTDALIRQAEALQQNTRFGDEQIIAQQSYLASLGLTQQQIEDTISASLDLAAATGMSLESAVMNTSKTLSGMAGELGEKLGPGFREISQEALKAGEGIKFIAEQFGGTAQADASSFNGQLDQMKNAVGDAAEALGESLAPIVTKIAKGLKSAAESFQTFMRATTEGGLEQTIREMKALGMNTKELELSLVREKQLRLESTTAIHNQQLAAEGYADAEEFLNDIMTNRKLLLQWMEQEQKIMNSDADEESKRKAKADFEEAQRMLETNTQRIDMIQQLVKDQEKLNRLKLEEQALNTEIHTDKQKAIDEEENKLTKKEKKLAGLIAGNLEKQTANILKSSTVKKGSAIQEGTENAYTMAQNAYKAFADIKIVGPVLGALAASAAFALGMSQVQGIRSAQYGADFVTDGPQMMMVGEGSGPERVQVTPLVDPNLEGPQGGGGVTLNISGNVLHESFVEDEIIPQIREGLRMGENMGI
tara:strand:- start:5988 stop:7646 length:1659 start_codon:yes stop_codon:yes gene_type:complete